MLKRLSEMVACVLEVPVPRIEEVDELNTKTQAGAMDIDNNVLYLRKSASQPDKMFAIAHELRHVWQDAHDACGLSEHIAAGTVDTITYNRQPSEIDANAFGVIVMSDVARLKPMFDGFDEETKRMIFARADEIAQEMEKAQG